MTTMHPDDVEVYVAILPRAKRLKRLVEPVIYAVHQVFEGTAAIPGAYIGAVLHLTDPDSDKRVLVWVGENGLDLKLFDAGAVSLGADEAIKFNSGGADTDFGRARDAVQQHIATIRSDVNMKLYNLDRKLGGFTYQNTVNYVL